jgi:IPT/TIG domain
MQRIRVWIAVGVVVAFELGAEAADAGPARAQADAVPVIERVEPTSGPPGTVVHVIGRRFGTAGKLQIGAQTLEIVGSQPNRISGRIPPDAQSGHVAVVTAGGTVRGPEFRVTATPPAPVIQSVVPAKGPPGTPVVLRGKNFSPRLTGNVVMMGGRPVIVRSATPVELSVIVPEVERGGPFSVRVEQAGEATSAPFEVTAATLIAAVEPPRAGPGTQVKITGSGFSTVAERNRVYLNSVPLPVKTATETQLVVQLPAKVASGKLLVDVKGAGRAYSDEPFVVQRPPKVVDFTPKGGPPGTVVTVRGTNFGTSAEAVEAKLGDVELRVREARNTRMELEITAGATPGKLSVRVNGVGPAWSDASFAVRPPLKIIGFTPPSGPAGTEVTIEGEGFGDAPGRNRVTIGDVPARVTEVATSRLKVRVPKGKSGPIEVEVPGSGAARTSAPFIVTVPPQVTGVTPRQGPVGTELKIEGKGFGNNAAVLKVFLGDVPLAVQSVEDNLAVARIVDGAATGQLKVAVPLQGMTELDWEFKVLPASTPAPAAATPAAPAPAKP